MMENGKKKCKNITGLNGWETSFRNEYKNNSEALSS